MAFAQLTWRESLRDIEACLRAHSTKLYHLGIRGNVARNTLANANATRDWRIYCDFAQRLIGIARRLYAEALGFLEELGFGRWVSFHCLRDGCFVHRAVFRPSDDWLPSLPTDTGEDRAVSTQSLRVVPY